MADDPRVAQLLDELLDELLDSHATPEEVCGACPELLSEVRTRWRRMCRVRDELEAMFPTPREPDAGPLPSQDGASLPQIPGYEVQSVLGRGGMGVVFRARHLRLNRVVALKMVLAGAYAGPQERERFQREAEAVAGLRHPNVVQVHDVGDSDSRPYFTMEFVEGGSLAQKLDGTPFPARRAAGLVAVLAGAVDAAHRGGIVHRDLKPANVLLTADGTPKVSDFGLARRLDGGSDLTRTGTTLGTPSYMAPEQAGSRADAIGPAADLYALGAILYELLTGRPPLRAASPEETLQQVLSRDPVPPSRRNVTVPRDLETVCLKCLHKEPRLRYVTAAALAEDLERFLRGEAIAARPERRWERLVRRVRRRPVLYAALAAGVVFATALTGSGLWLVSARAAAEREAQAERATAERAAEKDLQEMAQHLRASSWPEARAALERAKGRLNVHSPVELRRRLGQGTRELETATRLEAIRLDLPRNLLGATFARPDGYEEAFRSAGLGQIDEPPETVAARVRGANIPDELVAALDHWSAITMDLHRRRWALSVARHADPGPDPTGWRARARDPAVRMDQEALVGVIRTAPVAETPVPLLLALAKHLRVGSPERLPFLKRVQQAHPGDYWTNLTLGDALVAKSPGEAVRYYQAAAAIQPRMALGFFKLGTALFSAGRHDEAADYYRRAVGTDPNAVFSHQWLALTLMRLGRHEDAVETLKAAIGFNPNASGLHTTLGHTLEVQGRDAEALAYHQRAVANDPKNSHAQQRLRTLQVRLGSGEKARGAWETVLKGDPPGHDAWYGYAEFCLFLGREDEYRRARRALLAKFGAATDPFIAERTARACLLLPGADDELRDAVALAGRAAGAEQSKYQEVYPHFLFVRGLAEYRQGRFAEAIATTRGDAARVLGPAPRLLLAMALYRSGQESEARATLAAAVLAHDWRTSHAGDQDGWIYHALRREAETLILPNLAAFLDGKYQPRDNDERVALLGVCRSTNRPLAAARLYADAFAANPNLAEDYRSGNRASAAGVAALAGCGRGTDAAALGEPERTRWRRQAREWLRADLAAWNKELNEAPDDDPVATYNLVLGKVIQWLIDPDLSPLREPRELKKLPPDEQKDCLAMWDEIRAVLDRAESTR